MPQQSEAIDTTKKPETFLFTVEVDITDEEAGERTKHLLDVLNQIDTVEMDKASRVSDLNAQLKQLRKEATKVRQAIKIGKEKRDFECYEVPEERTNTVHILRASDGKKMDERAMTLEDRMHLPGKSKEQAKKDDAAANGSTTEPETTGTGGGTEEAPGKAGKAGKAGGGKGGAGNVTRLKASDVKKRKSEREAKDAAEKAKKLADEQDAKNAAADDEDGDSDDSDEDDDE